MAVSTGTVANCTFLGIALNLMGRELVKIFRSVQSGPHSNFTHLTGPVMNTGYKIIADCLMTGNTLFLVLRRWPRQPVARVGLLLISAIPYTIMTSCTSYSIVTGSFERVITFTTKVDTVIRLVVRGFSTTTSNRWGRIRRMYRNQSVIVRMASLAGVGFNLTTATTTSRNLIVGTTNPGYQE
jgi:hypothetical protein